MKVLLELLGSPRVASLPLRGAAGTLLLLALAAPACGNSSSDGAGSGGAGTSGRASGGKSSAGKTGSGGKSNGGGGDTSSPGDFSGVWRFESVEFNYVDNAAPTEPISGTASFPKTIAVPQDGREAEFLQQFVGEQLITYAYYAGDPAYYRITQSAYMTQDSYVVDSGNTGHVFTLEDGKLIDSSVGTSETAFILTKTIYEKLDGAFPPSDWPSESLTYEVAEDL